MVEIELWEQEIEKSNRFNLFEETNRIVDYLSESIKLDCEMVESGILTEGAGTIALKFVAMIAKIIIAINNLRKKIKVFIRDKIQAFKQNNIVGKFEKGKIDEEKMVNKLNSTNLFDPEKLQDAFDTAVATLNKTKDFGDSDAVTKSLGKSAGILGFTRAEEEENGSKAADKFLGFEHTPDEYFVRINPKSDKAKAEIIRLYEKTADCLDEFSERTEEFERKLESMKKEIEGNNDKDDVKHLKAEVTYVKGLYKATMRISKKFLQQVNTLQGIMVAYTKSDGEVEEQEA